MFVRILVIIGPMEALVMGVLTVLGFEWGLLTSVADAVLLTLLSSPLLYYWVIRPETRQQMKHHQKELGLTKALKTELYKTISTLAAAVYSRDPSTSFHQQHASNLARAIAQEMGLSAEQAEGIRIGSILHDIGAIKLPAEILAKPARLNEAEYVLIKTHARASYELLKDINFPWPVAELAFQHHERMDGSGYPRGLKGEEIAPEAKILIVADVVSAMMSHRPWRAALSLDEVLREIKSHRGTYYDPDAVDACVRLFEEKGFTLG